MPSYKIAVSKDGKKYSIVFKADNELLARERVHKEWYSILSLEELDKRELVWNVFIFEAIKNWELKKWKIVWNDIFKVYVKLRKNLEYDVKKIYDTKDIWLDENSKNKIIKNLQDEYDIFYSNWKKEKIDELREKIQKEKENKNHLDNFYMKKQLEDTNILLSTVILKIDSILNWSAWFKLDNEKIIILKNIYNEIIKLKKSTNISKLKEIWELALKKIWKIELEELEKTKTKESRDLLKQTNKLLKNIGSREQFTEKDKDINYQINNFFSKIKKYLYTLKNVKNKQELDKESHSYIKTLLFLSRYKERLKQNNQYILKNIFKILLNPKLKEDVFLKRNVIKQNIVLLSAKQKWINYSYTYAKKWIKKFDELFKKIILDIKSYIFLVIFIYFLIFISYINIWPFFDLSNIDYYWIFLLLLFIVLYFFLSLSKNIFLFFINFVFFSFIVIFWVINF